MQDDLKGQKTFWRTDDGKKTFVVPAYWEMYGYAKIRATNLEDAILIAENETKLEDFDADYVMDSFNVDSLSVEEKNNNG